MNQEIKARWVAALRDGRPQTTRVLERVEPSGRLAGKFTMPPGQCCLGVLCSIAAEDGVVKRVVGTEFACYEDTDGQLRSGTLPDAVVRWAGLSGENPMLPQSEKFLSNLNDEGATFAEIADLIEREL